ncbi:PAS domain S-box-containing protein [Roseospira marina]|nr:PAS domain S-box-containing protein [Roseospira marina]MBB5087301.1 PAS domain S-box-containing protein [Roseospira marina]
MPSFAIATAILILALIFIGTTERFVSRGLQREKALDAESRQLSSFREAVLENAGLPIIVCDHAAGIVFFNQAAERLLGYPVADVVGRMSLWAILTLDPRHYDPDSHAAASRSTDVRADDNVPSDLRMLSESRRALEGVYIRKDGSTLPVVLSVSTLHRDEGRPGGYVVIAQDRSGEHSAERALRFSEQRQRAILDNILDGIFTINVSGVVSSMNPAGERIFGYTREEVLGRNISILMDNTHRNKHDDYIRRYMQTGEERIIGRGREVPARRKDGTVFPVELSVSRVEFAGRVMFVGVVRDLSEIKKVERLKAEFVSIVSHELRTPLTAMRGSLNMVNSEMLGPLDPDVKELTEIAEQSTDRLIRLINDILDVEKIGAGKLQLHCDLVSIEESLKRAHKDIEPYAAQYDVAVIVDMASDATVWADFDRLQQIILNLASNAVKFSPRGGTVRMASWVETPGWIRVSVEDKGPGIALEFQDRIFEKFAQADSSDRRAKGGTGLGLNITKALTEQMGGHIGFESVPGEGATFYVDFPLREERRGPTTIHAFHLEDNEAIRLIVAHMLSERARITSAGSLEEGLRLAEQHTYDVAILDLGLHDGNGLELVSVLHDGQGGTPPLIILTGQDDLPPDMPPTAAVLTKGRESERAIVERIRDVIDRLFPEAATLSKDTAHES